MHILYLTITCCISLIVCYISLIVYLVFLPIQNNQWHHTFPILQSALMYIEFEITCLCKSKNSKICWMITGLLFGWSTDVLIFHHKFVKIRKNKYYIFIHIILEVTKLMATKNYCTTPICIKRMTFLITVNFI